MPKSVKRKQSVAELIERIENVEKRSNIYIVFLGKVIYYLSLVVSTLGEIVDKKGNTAHNSDEAYTLHSLVEDNLGRMRRGEDLEVPDETDEFGHSFWRGERR